jgi:hypothetical protein
MIKDGSIKYIDICLKMCVLNKYISSSAYIRIKWVLCPGEQWWLGTEELLVGGCCGVTLMITTTIVLRWRLTLS